MGQKRTWAAPEQADLGLELFRTQAQPFICAVANVEVPAYLVLRQRAYTVSASVNDDWYAEKDRLRFQAESLIELLRLVTVYEARGTNREAADQEIDDFLMRYDY